MAAPTALTLSTLVAEGLKKAGVFSPSAALTTRAESFWMEEIKNEIWLSRRGTSLKSLYTSQITVLTNGKEKYSNPTDYASDLAMEILDGTHRDTAQAATASNITLAADEDVTDIVGREIFIRSATLGTGSFSNVVTYNTTTKVASISPNWQVTPTGTITYTIVDTIYPVDPKTIASLAGFDRERGIPDSFYPIGDADYGEFILHPVPYQSDSHVMGCKQYYFANLLTLDLAGTLIGTLYNNWKQVFTSGIEWRMLKELNDNKWKDSKILFDNLLAQMISKESSDGLNVSTIKGAYEEE